MVSIITKNGRKILLNRGYKEFPDFTVPSKGKIGKDNETPQISDSGLSEPLPIFNGTVLDSAENPLTGTDGGDNSTPNTSIFKQGAGVVDNTAQNLIANNSSILKSWIISNLSTNGSNAVGNQYVGLWLYIKDQTTFDKFLDLGTAVEIRIGSDASNYYSLDYTKSNLTVGWNWLSSNNVLLENLTSTGTVGTPLTYFQINITTNAITDTFIEGDVVYDLLRQWETNDLTIDFVSGFPAFDYVNNEVTIRMDIDTTKLNGFLTNSLSFENTDGVPLVSDISLTEDDSKSDTDEWRFIRVNRIR